jgi:hypothetical protein
MVLGALALTAACNNGGGSGGKNNAAPQSPKDLVGTWAVVSAEGQGQVIKADKPGYVSLDNGENVGFLKFTETTVAFIGADKKSNNISNNSIDCLIFFLYGFIRHRPLHFLI